MLLLLLLQLLGKYLGTERQGHTVDTHLMLEEPGKLLPCGCIILDSYASNV